MHESNTGRGGETTGRLKDEARRGAHEAGQQAQSLFDGQKRVTADEMGHAAKAFHSSADQLRDQDQAALADYADRAATGLNDLSHTLRDSDLTSLLRQTEGFAHRQPAMFVGGAVATGFLLSRFLRSTASRPESDYRPSQGGAHDTGRNAPFEPSPASAPGNDAGSTRTEPFGQPGSGGPGGKAVTDNTPSGGSDGQQ